MAKKVSLCLASLAVFIVFPVLLSAQDNMGMSGGKQSMSVTGCLKQGSDTGGYYIMGQDGKMYELMGKGLGRSCRAHRDRDRYGGNPAACPGREEGSQ